MKAHPTEQTGQGMAPQDQRLTHSGGNAERVDLSGEGVPQLRWHPDAVRRLDEDVEWALTSNPTGAAEVCGVLLGKVGPTIEITDSQPVFLMYPRDHAYALAGPGRGEFERTITAFQSTPEDQPHVIGFYRSDIGSRLNLTEEDLGFIRTCFRDITPVVLLIKHTEPESSSVRLFSGDQDEVFREFHCSVDASALPRWLELWHCLSEDGVGQPAEFDATTSTHTTKPADRPNSAEVIKAADIAKPTDPAFEDPPILTVGEVHENPLTLRRYAMPGPLSLLAAAVVLALLFGYLMQRGSARVSQGAVSAEPDGHDARSGSSHATGFALRAERHGDDLRLDWDRTAPVLVAATGGMLTIREGNGREKQVMLDGNLLRTGAVVYRPVHGDVFLRLVIFGQEGAKMGESTSTYSQRMSGNGSNAHKESQ
ncbi:MAG: hypothetical protein ACR2IV_20865 [Bryobacteraceae bacterium]